MTEVESRFLQVSISPITTDRVTVGLVHWDGTTMRVAHSMDLFPRALKVYRRDFLSTIRALLKDAQRQAEKLRGSRATLTLDEVFPVRTGAGAGLQWSPVQHARTTDAQHHFENLKALVGIVEATRERKLSSELR